MDWVGPDKRTVTGRVNGLRFVFCSSFELDTWPAEAHIREVVNVSPMSSTKVYLYRIIVINKCHHELSWVLVSIKKHI